MLVGASKKLVQTVIKYYVETTGNEYFTFLSNLDKPCNDICEYDIWLAHKLMGVISKNNISKEELVQNKDILRSSSSKKGVDEGEFYTPEIWCQEGRKYLKDLLGDQWGKVYIWDASCGTGNLLRTSGYPQDKIFLSTLLEEDVSMVKESYPEATVFQCDFLNGIDYDEENEFFSSRLPKKLQEILHNNEPIVFLMNPPYRQGKTSISDIGEYMVGEGMSNSARDICAHFFYRLIMLKRYYKLTNMTLGLFHPASFLTFKSFFDLIDEMLDEFKFTGGMCFTASDFAGCKCGVSWSVVFTTWMVRDTPHERGTETNILLDAKTAVDGEVKFLGKRLFGRINEYINKWAKDRSGSPVVYQPMVSHIETFSGKSQATLSNALGWYSGSADNGRHGTRPLLLSCPYSMGQPVTTENFWRVLAMLSVSNIADFDNPLLHSQYTKAPDTSMEGYEQWIIDSIPLALFGLRSFTFAFRGVKQGRDILNISNNLFPISKEIVQELCTDENILEDMRNNGGDNSFILGVLKEFAPKFSKEAKDLYEFGITSIAESLAGTFRRDANYPRNTISWDACFQQVRSIETYWSDEKDKEYFELVRLLREKLQYGVFTYGFWEDVNYVGGNEDE